MTQATGSQPQAAAKRLLWAAGGCGERRTGGAAIGLWAEEPGTCVGRSFGTATSSRLWRRAAGRLMARTLAWREAARAEEDACVGVAADAGLNRRRRGEPLGWRGRHGDASDRVTAASGGEASALGCRRVR